MSKLLQRVLIVAGLSALVGLYAGCFRISSLSAHSLTKPSGATKDIVWVVKHKPFSDDDVYRCKEVKGRPECTKATMR